MAQFNLLKGIYQFFTKDLSIQEFDRLIKREVPGVYSFYIQDTQKPDESKNRFFRTLLFIRNLFVAFLKKLSPLRRLIYLASVILFFIGYTSSDKNPTLLGFALLTFLLMLEVADKLTVKGELDAARRIQLGLIPKSPPVISGLDISCFSDTALEVGGDYFDFLTTSKEGQTIFVIGDISGKGLGAALYMVQVRAILHHLSGTHTDLKPILIELNRSLFTLLERNSFFTASLVSILKDGSLSFCRAGHLPALFYSAKEKSCKEIIPKGIGLGLSQKGLFQNTLEEVSLYPMNGDILILFTDGITEAMDLHNNQYGIDRMKEVVLHYAHEETSQIQARLLSSVGTFCGDAPPNDDLTFIIIKFLEVKTSEQPH